MNLFTPMLWHLLFSLSITVMTWGQAVNCLTHGRRARREFLEREALHQYRLRVERGESVHEPINVLVPRKARWRVAFSMGATFCWLGLGCWSLVGLVTAFHTSVAAFHAGQFHADHDYIRASTAYRTALAADPVANSLHTHLETTLTLEESNDGEYGYAKRMVRNHPGDWKPHDTLASVLVARDDLAGAAVEYRQAIQLDPNNPASHNNLGNVLRKLGRLDDAEQEVRRTLELDSSSGAAHANLADICYMNHKLTLAISEYRIAITLDPKRGTPYFNLALALRSTGRSAESLAVIDQLLKESKHDPEMSDVAVRAATIRTQWTHRM